MTRNQARPPGLLLGRQIPHHRQRRSFGLTGEELVDLLPTPVFLECDLRLSFFFRLIALFLHLVDLLEACLEERLNLGEP